MFTGIIEQTGTIRRITRGAGTRLAIQAEKDLDGTGLGDSIAVNGACLTVTSLAGRLFTVDVSPETVERTILREARVGDRVNMERAMVLGGRLDGHLVTGHIDGVGTLASRNPSENAIILGFTVAPELARYMVEKGSVAVDGVSLTINTCDDNGFTVAIIPHTAKLTTVGRKQPGDRVNIECDIIGKYVERFVTGGRPGGDRKHAGGIDMETLAKNGFL
ncbi:MAG: riboflavin synthase [Desulfatibacillaceae bacterium]